MLDIKWIQDNPDALDSALAKRGMPPAAAPLVALNDKRRQVIHILQNAQERRNIATREYAQAKRDDDHDRCEALMAEMMLLKQTIKERTGEQKTLDEGLIDRLMQMPNVPAHDVQAGTGADDNVLISESQMVGRPNILAERDFERKEHFEVRAAVDLMDFPRAANMAKSRFVVLRGILANMERALGQFMLDQAVRVGHFHEVSPPLIVNKQAMTGTGQLPKFRDQLFEVLGPTADTDFYLIPTAEVPLVNLVAGTVIPNGQLPFHWAALTPCFRSEAGASGKDTHGMIRQHQFNKVELVSICEPEHSNREHEFLVHCVEDVLDQLELKYRIMRLCSGEMGFAAQKTYDVEVWLPGQKTYREISSISNCGDFQARRIGAKVWSPNGTEFVHTLNASGVAVGRALVAVIENFQDSDGSVWIPLALRSYMNGAGRIA